MKDPKTIDKSSMLCYKAMARCAKQCSIKLGWQLNAYLSSSLAVAEAEAAVMMMIITMKKSGFAHIYWLRWRQLMLLPLPSYHLWLG